MRVTAGSIGLVAGGIGLAATLLNGWLDDLADRLDPPEQRPLWSENDQ